MNDKKVTLLITCDSEIIEDLRDAISGQDALVQTSPRRQIDGASATSWLLVVTVAIHTAPQLLQAIRDLLTRNNIREIKFDKVSITNPRAEDIPRILDAINKHEPDQ
jgi:hypothetical protein